MRRFFTTKITIIVLLAISMLCLISCIDKKNDFTANIYSTDYEFLYNDSDGVNVKTIIVPKYDFVDFSYKLTYYGNGLLNEYEKEISVGTVKAGTKIENTELISNIESNMNSAYSYTSITVTGGKKQKKYDKKTETVYNEIDFISITMKGWSGTYFTFEIKNTTDYYIKEIRELRIEMDFEDDISCKFYKPRIKLDMPLAPHSKTTLTNISGNTHMGLGTSNTDEKKDKIRAGITTRSVSNQTYQIVYEQA